MPRKPSVRVQMADDPAELERISRAAAANPPKREPQNDPITEPDNTPNRGPVPPDDEPPDDFDDDPDDDDFGEDVDPSTIPAADRPAEPPHIARTSVPIVANSPRPPGLKRYRSRIRVVEAWQYLGSLRDAPEFVSRDWVSYAAYDPVKNIEPGPALRVPTSGAQVEKLARSGDYIVRQEITLVDGLDAEEQVDVWSREEFERLFIPTTSRPPDEQRSAIEGRTTQQLLDEPAGAE